MQQDPVLAGDRGFSAYPGPGLTSCNVPNSPCGSSAVTTKHAGV